jgi:hypothetical protein
VTVFPLIKYSNHLNLTNNNNNLQGDNQMPTVQEQVKTKKVKPSPQTVKSEREINQGMQAHQFNPNDLTIVDRKHPLKELLYWTRNDKQYEAGSAAVEEFKRQGQLQPGAVFPYKNPNTGQTELVVAFGNQRTLMARAAGIPVEMVLHKDWTAQDAANAAIVENEQRMNLSFKDQMMAVRRQVKTHREAKTKQYFHVVGALFNKSHQWARDMYAVSQLPPDILKKVPDVVSFATAIQLTKVEPVDDKQSIAEAQSAAYEELMSDEKNIGQKGTVKAEKALSNRVGKAPIDKLSSVELRVIIANEDLDLSLSDEDVRILIAGIIGDKDVKEVQRAGIEWYAHPAKVEKAKTGKAAKNARKEAQKKEKQVSIEDLEFESEDEEETTEDDE